jgi:MFS transporter, DHA2 family, multidrug resistance protein
VLFRTPEERKKAIDFFVVANSIGMPLGPIVGVLLDDAGRQRILTNKASQEALMGIPQDH